MEMKTGVEGRNGLKFGFYEGFEMMKKEKSAILATRWYFVRRIKANKFPTASDFMFPTPNEEEQQNRFFSLLRFLQRADWIGKRRKKSRS